MKLKNIAIVILLGIIISIYNPNKVYAITCELNLADENIYIGEGSKTNTEETATFDVETNTLILNNYDGGEISFDCNEELNIVLIGENTITGDYTKDGISVIDKLNITGEGNLTITKVKQGIYLEDKELTIESTNVSIIDIKTNGIHTTNGDILINNSNLEIDKVESDDPVGLYTETGNIITNNSDITIEHIQNGNAIFIVTGNLIVNSNIDIKNVMYGIANSCQDVIINGGNVNIEVVDAAILANNFTINDGILKIKSQENGIVGNTSIKINGGYLEIEANDEKPAIYIVTDETPIFNISENMEILPNELSIQESSLTIDFTPPLGTEPLYSTIFTLKTIGENDVELTFDGSMMSINNAASKVIIREKEIEEEIEEVNPKTSDNITINIILLISALTIIFKLKNNLKNYN